MGGGGRSQRLGGRPTPGPRSRSLPRPPGRRAARTAPARPSVWPTRQAPSRGAEVGAAQPPWGHCHTRTARSWPADTRRSSVKHSARTGPSWASNGGPPPGWGRRPGRTAPRCRCRCPPPARRAAAPARPRRARWPAWSAGQSPATTPAGRPRSPPPAGRRAARTAPAWCPGGCAGARWPPARWTGA
jgi:hypothetical protein